MADSAVLFATQELLEGPTGTPMSYWQLVRWRLRQDKVTLAAAAVILAIVLSAILAPYIAPHDPLQGSIRKRLAPIGTPGNVLGTDEQGRDMLSRLLFGGRKSLTAGVVPVCVALLAGSTLGLVAGFMEAARASGAGPVMIMCHQMLANVLAPIFVYASTLVSVSVILASGLSFLGLGASPPHPEWGMMLNTLRQSIYVNAWVPVLPGVMIFLTSMAFNLLSDGLRDAMDVRL